MDRPSTPGPAAVETQEEQAEKRFGAKCARLLHLSGHPRFSEITLPVLPLADTDAREFLTARGADSGDLVPAYAAFLRDRRPDLPDRVAAVCGPGPWIVRSSGAEDLDHNVNAGGYESLVCAGPADLFPVVSAVVWSGYAERAVAQQRLADPGYEPAPIAVFVQPLVAAPVEGPPPAADETPLLDEATVAALGRWTALLHDHFALERLDCEWVLETDAGLVSVTGLTERTGAGPLTGQLSLGFGFASAQRLDGTDNSLAWLTGDPGTTLWRGEVLRATGTRVLRLVQVRPAEAFDPAPTLRVLTGEARREWDERCASRPADLLVPPRTVAATAFLTATRLDEAWAQYLLLDPARRDRTGHVLVERGSPAEHAAVMFRQYGVAVLRGRPEDVPESASYVLADPWAERCWFGSGRPPAVRTEERRFAAVPPGCRLLSGADSASRVAADAVARGERLTPEDMPGLDRLRAPAHLSPAAYRRLVDGSFLPDPACWRREGTAVVSPAFAAQVVDAALALSADPARVLAVAPPEAGPYARGLVAARAAGASGVAVALPRCAAAAGADLLASAVAGRADVRFAVALARLEGRAGLSPAVLGALLPAALRLTGEAAGRAATALVEAVESLGDAFDALDVYSAREREEIPLRLLEALPLADAAATEELCRLARRSALPPGETVRLVAAAAADRDFAGRYLALERGRVALAAAGPAEAPARARELAGTYRAYAAAPALTGDDHRQLPVLARCDLIETYDAALKHLLLELVDRPDRLLHEAYLGVMSAWLDLAAAFGLSEREARAVRGFEEWIARWRAAGPAADHTIEENASWRRLLEAAASSAPAPPNAHQLHNGIHQWLLATTERYPAGRAPSGVAALHEVADRFCRGGDKLLRLTRDAFELDVPLSLHKASLLFTPDRVEAEWSEQPDVTEDLTGRLLAFEVLLERFGHWFPAVSFRTERLRMAGTWTLRIEARPGRGAERFRHEDMALVLGLLRTLFDGSYDFSYVPAEEVAGLADAVRDPRWRTVFTALLDYRERYDDSAQYETLETLPLATAVATLCTDVPVRETVLRLSQEGPGAAVAELDALARAAAGADGPSAWMATSTGIAQVALLLAARHPHAAVEVLAERPGAAWAGVLATALLPRRDVRERVVAALGELRDAPGDGFGALVLRHAPHLVVRAGNAVEVCRAVLKEPKAHRRAKQYLAHAHAAALAPAGLLGPLVAELEVVPYGRDDEQEAVLAGASAEAGGRLRAGIRSKVDETHPVFLRAR
ncbi:hypothetical protein [Streptomyces sp. UNOB3_S3]|uniref:hypothetical protein n=1 Tax=Streptomyces sp. UNOB3_S3 TaxID=2871682 RepID=UPI001E5BF947|nr:hypothetical protein [Streptomyces sp. UNOB3_S3]MCC3776397.1 hypothetical protein [Streptomyces sp. UNOB3_S3]